MTNERPATLRQRQKLQELNIEFDPEISMLDATMLLRDAQADLINLPESRVPIDAIAVGSDLDPIGGRQWEK